MEGHYFCEAGHLGATRQDAPIAARSLTVAGAAETAEPARVVAIAAASRALTATSGLLSPFQPSDGDQLVLYRSSRVLRRPQGHRP